MATSQKQLNNCWLFLIAGILSILFSCPTLADSTDVRRPKRHTAAIDTLLVTNSTVDTIADENAHINPNYIDFKPIPPTPQPLYSLFFKKTILDGIQIDSCVGSEQRQPLYNWLECDTAYYLMQYIGYDLQPKRQRQSSPDALLFCLLMLVVIMFTVTKTLSENFWGRVMEAFTSLNLAKQFFEEQLSYQSALPNTLIYAAISVLSAIWLFLLLRHFGQATWLTDVQLILILLGISGAYFTLRQLLLGVAAYVLQPLYQLIAFYKFNLTLSNAFIAAFLTPLGFLFAFGHQTIVTNWLIYVLITLLLLAYLYNLYRAWQISKEIALNYKFHYLLYLLAFEIAPILLFAKFAKNNF